MAQGPIWDGVTPAAAMQVERYEPAWAPATRAFNNRLRAGGWNDFGLPESTRDSCEPAKVRGVTKQHFVVTDGPNVRGGFLLQRQPFWVAGAEREVANYQSPISEGATNRQYAPVASIMARHALRINPLMFAVGMGSAAHALPRMLGALGWRVGPVPFLFKIRHVGRCLAELGKVQQSARVRLAAMIARATGAAWLATRLWHVYSSVGRPKGVRLRTTPIAEWGPWADEVWSAARSASSMIGVRNTTTLQELYPPTGRELCFRIEDAGRPIGWAVILDTQMDGHRHFGGLRVGTVLDCLTVPGYTNAAASAVANIFDERNVDLVITNQSHRDWISAFRRAGFLPGPSNYLLAMSKGLMACFGPTAAASSLIHVTRGDGDGRINL
jgi:hypothetical protein